MQVRTLEVAVTVLVIATGVGCSSGPRGAELDAVGPGASASSSSPSSPPPSARALETLEATPKRGGFAAGLVRDLASAKAGERESFIYERAADGTIDTLRVDGRPGGTKVSYIQKRPGSPPRIWRLEHTGSLATLEAVATSDVWSRTYDQEQRPARIDLAFLFWASDGKETVEKRMFKSLPADLKALTEELEGLMSRCEKEGVLAGSGPRKKGIGKGPPIGQATMKPDGTIVLDLRAELPEGGGHGHGRVEYPKGHREYADILEHLGGLQPGESKVVPPWPE